MKISVGASYPATRRADVIEVADDATEEEINEAVEVWALTGVDWWVS